MEDNVVNVDIALLMLSLAIELARAVQDKRENNWKTVKISHWVGLSIYLPTPTPPYM